MVVLAEGWLSKGMTKEIEDAGWQAVAAKKCRDGGSRSQGVKIARSEAPRGEPANFGELWPIGNTHSIGETAPKGLLGVYQ